MWYNIPINAEIIKFIQSFSNPFLDKLFQYITMMGEEYFFIVVLTLIYWCIDKRLGYKIGFAILGSNVFNIGIKEIVKSPRPIGREGIRSLRVETAGGYSFPSGHTQSTTSFWFSLMLYYKKRFLYIIGIILIFLVGLSRLYLGVHWPTDVIGGICAAVIWVLISNTVFEYAEKTGRKIIFLVILIPVLILMLFIRNSDLYKSCGMLFGFYAGYIIEPAYIKFEVKALWWQNVLKMVIGIGGIMAVRLLLKPILPAAIISDFVRYMLMSIWAVVAAPYIFKKLFGKHSEEASI